LAIANDGRLHETAYKRGKTMSQPRIRHLAIISRDPAKLSEFYQSVFEMELIHVSPHGRAFYLSDGYLTLAILPHRLEGEAAVGINHFGWSVEDSADFSDKLVAAGVEEPKARPSTRPFAELRGVDPEGNQFDLSEHGFDQVEYAAERAKKKTLADS
jgi:catechol 2,3-dioxygenase-like lactoylglutathione lyase family enzyme